MHKLASKGRDILLDELETLVPLFATLADDSMIKDLAGTVISCQHWWR